MIDEAADQHVRDQSRGRNALVDDLGSDGLLHQCLAAPAGPFAADVAMHEELGRHDIELLGDVLANARHRLAATRSRTDGASRFMLVVDASQMIGQERMSWPDSGLLLRQGRRRCALLALKRCQLCLQAGLVFGQRLLEHLALPGVHALGPGSEPVSLQASELEHDAFDLHVLEPDQLRLLGDERVLLVDAREHLCGHPGPRIRTQALEVLCVESGE